MTEKINEVLGTMLLFTVGTAFLGMWVGGIFGMLIGGCIGAVLGLIAGLGEAM